MLARPPSPLRPARSGERYLAPAQLAAAAANLAERYPARCRLRAVGRSRAGQPLLLLSVSPPGGSLAEAGGDSVLVTAGPHANEPAGGMAVLRLARLLLNGELAPAPGEPALAWHLLLCLDPDGACRNQRWLRGPFTLASYHRGLFRPACEQQPEWSPAASPAAPPLPETRALLALIDELRPRLQCSLHGVDLGGSFVQLTREVPGVVAALGGSAARHGMPLALGAEDAASWPSPGPGVFVLPPDPTQASAACQADPRRSTWCHVERYGGLTAVVESPMWAVDRVADAAPHPNAARAVAQAADELRDGCAHVAEILAASGAEALLDGGDPLVCAALGPLAFGPRLAAHWRLDPPPAATVARVTELEIMACRTPLRAAAMLARSFERLLELAQLPPGAARADVARAQARLGAFITASCAAIERRFAPRWVPIARQADHQARTVLAIAGLVASAGSAARPATAAPATAAPAASG